MYDAGTAKARTKVGLCPDIEGAAVCLYPVDTVGVYLTVYIMSTHIH